MGEVDTPQAERLDHVRSVVAAVQAGTRKVPDIAAQTQLTDRYVRYALQAARLLELLERSEEGHAPSSSGRSLLLTARGSRRERDLLKVCMESVAAVSRLSDVLLDDETPSRAQLAELLIEGTGASLTTALRRAGTLLAWRRYVVEDESEQLRIAGLDWDEDADALPPEPPAVDVSIDGVEANGANPESGTDDTRQVTAAPASGLPDRIQIPDAAISGPADADETEPPPAEPRQPVLTDNELAYFRSQIERGQMILFTGAGFSLGTRDVAGGPLPTAAGFTKEAWSLCYPDEPYDNSSLQDVFEHARRMHHRGLDELLRRRFSIDSSSIPEWFIPRTAGSSSP